MDIDEAADQVIGLDVRGKIFYCNKTKLLSINNGHSYFSARFREDSMLDASLDRVDDEGRNIYKLDRDPSIFAYIMEYVNTLEKPNCICASYEKNKQLWELVREEALYFGLDSLVQLTTFSCSPDVDGDKGIMYWLGTKKGTSDYVNPYSSGAVSISRWDVKGRLLTTKDPSLLTTGERNKSLMVQYRPIPEGEEIVSMLEEVVDVNDITWEEEESKSDIFAGSFGAMMGCGACLPECSGGSVNFQLLNRIAISPTHYSIRNGGCYGMAGDWNLEASTDGTIWDVIHKARGRQPKLYGGVNENDEDAYTKIWDMALACEGTESRKEVVCDYMEENHRNTWQVNNTARSFYTHFRFVSIEVNKSDEDDDRRGCLHGIGFELYGDVYEEWGDKSESRIEQLEDQNKEVLNENKKLQVQNEALLSEIDSLKARVRQLENKRNAEEACLSED